MATSTKFCKTVSQSTGGKYVTWSDLNNIRNTSSGAYAVSSVLIKGKNGSPNRPSTITCTNFDFNLPVGAEPTKVVVEYNHKKNPGSDWTDKDKHICNIGAPTITLLGVNGFSGKGGAPSLDFVGRTKTFNVKGKLTRTQVNSTGFGVKIDYPSNSNGYDGWMSLGYVRVRVEYKTSSYSLGLNKVGGTGYNHEDYTLQLSISNVNRTNYKDKVTLTSPTGFSFKSAKGTGTITMVNTRTFTWDPKLSNKVGTSSINVVFTPNVTYPTGQSTYRGEFAITETLNGTTARHTAVITERPTTPTEQTEPTTEDMEVETEDQFRLHHVEKNTQFSFTLQLTDEEWEDCHPTDATTDTTFTYVGLEQDIMYAYVNDGWEDVTTQEPISFDNTTHNGTIELLGVTPGTVSLLIEATYNVEVSGVSVEVVKEIATFTFEVQPDLDDLSTPNFSILEPTNEEYDRLGTGYNYICQTFLKHTTTDDFERDWYKNNRIGIFNNPIEANINVEEFEVDGEIVEVVTDSTDYDNLTEEQIFNNAEYWSEAPTTVNSFNNLECEFTFNEEYPLYILFTGDYPEATTYGYDEGRITYTTPCIVEKPVYDGREATGNYPLPIKNLILNDGSSAEQEIGIMDSSTPVIVYEYPLTDGYGNTEDLSIRGLEIRGNIEQSTQLVLSAKLTNPDGISGQRSIIIDNQDTTIDSETEFSLGGLGDNWGFTIEEIHDLEDWELEITVQNILEEETGNINYGNIRLIVYTEEIEKQEIRIKINGEDIGFYGVFIDNAKIPEGLETDTSFLNIDGTDTNDAYRQNIREKTIELELSISDCSFQNSTDMLRQFTKLLVNDKDIYNRPIPNRIEFSHYPDVYFEYIMKDAMDVTQDTGAYNIKAKLVVPAGTSYSKDDTNTNITGYVQGIAAINPVITIKPQSSIITIKEINSDQSFNISYGGNWQDGIVEIDCEDRVVLLKTDEDDQYPLDISGYVDFNSDWFSLHGEYVFNATGCVIRTITFTERW